MKRTMTVALVVGLLAVSVCACGDDDDYEPSGIRRDTATRLPIELSGSLQNGAFSPDGSAIVFTRFLEGYNEEPARLDDRGRRARG